MRKRNRMQYRLRQAIVVLSFILICLIVALAAVTCTKKLVGGGRGEETKQNETKNAGAQLNGTQPVNEPSNEPVNPPSNDPEKVIIKFLACGDALIHDSLIEEAKTFARSDENRYGGQYYFDPMYSEIAAKVKEADLAFINYECSVAGNSLGVIGYPNFNSPTESGDAIVRLGFNIVNIANNHMLDMEHKSTGYKNSISYWEGKKDVMMIGGYKDTQDYNTPRIVNSNGVNIAFLSYTYGTNGNKLNSSTSQYVVPYIDDQTIKTQIANAKQQAELVFVSMHWGNENVFNTTPEQKRLAKLIADCGADVIIGHHSHTVQPMEWITGQSGNKTLCIYSLGNLISTMLNSYNMVGGMVTFDIVKEGENKAYIDNPVFNPTVCHYNADPDKKDKQDLPTRTGIKVYMMENYTEALAKQHGSQICGGAFTFDKLKSYVKSTVSAEFLPAYLK